MCQPSSLQSKLRSIKTRLHLLQTVIDGQESRRTLDNMSKLHRSRLDMSFLHTTVGILAAGLRRNLVEDSMHWNRATVQTNTERGSVARDVPFAFVPRHTARMTSVTTPSLASVQEALKRMSLLRDNDFTARAVRDMIAEVEGRKPRNKKERSCTTLCTILERHPVRRSAR